MEATNPSPQNRRHTHTQSLIDALPGYMSLLESPGRSNFLQVDQEANQARRSLQEKVEEDHGEGGEKEGGEEGEGEIKRRTRGRRRRRSSVSPVF